MAEWKNPPWHPMAGLRLCTSDPCGDPVPDQGKPAVCNRCAILISEHVTAPKRQREG